VEIGELKVGEQLTYSVSEANELAPGSRRLAYFGQSAFDSLLRQSNVHAADKAALFAQMARFNVLYMVARAGSGHLGSSFSSLDIVTWLYLNVLTPADRYFSSKGHDAPGLYAVQTALGIIPFELIHRLRRIDGLPGHPDVRTPGAHTNTGSLGMGVSKAKGFLRADDLLGHARGRVFVLTGDGELQEGQFWESLIGASSRRDGRLTVIVDHNKFQSDTAVASVSDIGDLEAKFRAFGWNAVRCNGHDSAALDHAIRSATGALTCTAIIADTIKGRGVSFMEHTAMEPEQVYYRYHSGAPTAEDYEKACSELLADIDARFQRLGLECPLPLGSTVSPLAPAVHTERLIPAYGEAIVDLARVNSRVVALDADLVLDTGLIPFKSEFPDRFIECGIAEQDMVSQAGTMALAGLLPVVHSFAAFLTGRASEQIYNNCSQGGKVIYVGSLAGVLPGGPGHSHQAVRDIAAMSAMPGMEIVEPVTPSQVKHALRWAANEATGPVYIRLTSIPVQRNVDADMTVLPQAGCGTVVRRGRSIALLVAGPVLLSAVLEAVDGFEHRDGVTVISMPWLSRFDTAWLDEAIGRDCRAIVVLENHLTHAGFGAFALSSIASAGCAASRLMRAVGVEGLPRCGTNAEVLSAHGLDSPSIAEMLRRLYDKLT
jgi:transketolase